MKELIKLFVTFFKIGISTFGGGYAMISLINDECVNKNKWLTDNDMKQILIISESTPGPISINTATFVGYKVKKILGAIISTLGLILPSFIIITLISIFINYFKDNTFLLLTFESIRAAVIILMINAFISLFTKTKKDKLFYVLLISTFILNFILKIKAIYIILAMIIFSIIYSLTIKKEEK